MSSYISCFNIALITNFHCVHMTIIKSIIIDRQTDRQIDRYIDRYNCYHNCLTFLSLDDQYSNEFM